MNINYNNALIFESTNTQNKLYPSKDNNIFK